MKKKLSEIFLSKIAMKLGGAERTARSRFAGWRYRAPEIVEGCRPSEVKVRRMISRKNTRLIAGHLLPQFHSPNQSLQPTALLGRG
jgi:hypothetical protein